MGRTYSHTQISMFMECPMKFKRYYVDRVELRKRPNYFTMGSAVGNFIGVYYKSKDKKIARRQVEIEFDKVDKSILNAEESHRLECDRNIALGIADAYPSHYKEDFDQFDKFLQEQSFEIDIGHGNKYVGYIDVLVQDHAGDWWILETKTASQLNQDYFERVKIDNQVAGYLHGAKHLLGFWPKGVIYNVIKKPAIRLRSGESHSAFQKRVYNEYTKLAKEKGYFVREELIISDRVKKMWKPNVSFVAKTCTEMFEANEFWPMNTGSCQAKFGTCAYLPACVVGKYNKITYAKKRSR